MEKDLSASQFVTGIDKKSLNAMDTLGKIEVTLESNIYFNILVTGNFFFSSYLCSNFKKGINCSNSQTRIYLYWYWYKKKLHQKGTISEVRGGPLYRENKKRFKDWVGVDGICGCWSWRIEGYKLLGRR